jgi:hypothetical protein
VEVISLNCIGLDWIGIYGIPTPSKEGSEEDERIAFKRGIVGSRGDRRTKIE